MLEIVKVETLKHRRDFLNFPIKLYKDNPYFVPLLFMDERPIFKKNYFYNKVSESIFFNAYLDGKMVGRIHGIIHHLANEKWNRKRVRFTRFDSIDNQEVANGLFDAVVSWAKEKGITECIGPIGYSDLEREGLLIEGFNHKQTYAEQYNYDYYQKLIENYGFSKDVDWIEHKIYYPDSVDPRLEKVSNRVKEKFHLEVVKVKTVKEYVKKYGDSFFDMIDISYDKLYGTVPFIECLRKPIISKFGLLVRAKDLRAVVDEEGNMVAFSLVFPSITDCVRKSNGHCTPRFLWNFFKQKKNPKVLDLALVGVVPKYQFLGVSTMMLNTVLEYLSSGEIEYMETNLTLETNKNIDKYLSLFKREYTKRRRCFVKKI